MDGKRLFIFVEGASDERLVNEVIKPIFEKRLSEEGGKVVVTQYSHMNKITMNNLLISIESAGDDYILLKDRENARCITGQKEYLKKEHSRLDLQKVIVVVKVIEGWYFAGLNAASARKLKLSIPAKTDQLMKSEFNTAIPDNFKSGTDFMREILKYFDIETAKRKNKSFCYFVEKYQLDS